MYADTSYAVYDPVTHKISEPKSTVTLVRPVLLRHSEMNSRLPRVQGSSVVARYETGSGLSIYRYEPCFQYVALRHAGDSSSGDERATALSPVFSKFDADAVRDVDAYTIVGISDQRMLEPHARGAQIAMFQSGFNIPLRWHGPNTAPTVGHTAMAFPPGLFPGRHETRTFARPVSGDGCNDTSLFPHMGTMEEVFGEHINSLLHKTAFRASTWVSATLTAHAYSSYSRELDRERSVQEALDLDRQGVYIGGAVIQFGDDRRPIVPATRRPVSDDHKALDAAVREANLRVHVQTTEQVHRASALNRVGLPAGEFEQAEATFYPIDGTEMPELESILLLRPGGYADQADAVNSILQWSAAPMAQQHDALNFIVSAAMQRILVRLSNYRGASGDVSGIGCVRDMVCLGTYLIARLTDPAPFVQINNADAGVAQYQRLNTSIASIVFSKVPNMVLHSSIDSLKYYYCAFAGDAVVRDSIARYAVGVIDGALRGGYVTVSTFRRLQA